MNKSKNRSLKLGIMVASGLLLFVFAVYYLGSKQNLFSSSITVKSYFHNIKGLVEGNKVQYGGINVGTVSDIRIISDSTIMVEMSIDRDVKDFIKKDSKVHVGQEGLMGNKVISIEPGSSNAGSIEDDDQLQAESGVDLDELLEEAKKIIEDGQYVFKNLREVSEKINHGDGDLARLLNENTITTKVNETGDQLLQVSKNMNYISRKINQGQGDLGRLVNDTIVSHKLQQTIDELNHLTGRADSAAAELQQFGWELNHGSGLMHRLVYDSTMAEQVDTTITMVGNSVDDVAQTAETIGDSWIFRLFSGRHKKKHKN